MFFVNPQHKRYIVLTILLACAVSLQVRAQKKEIGMMLGGSYYYGDIVNEWMPSTIRGSMGAYLRYHWSENVEVKLFAGYCRVGGADSNSLESDYQRTRNLSFWSDIAEGSVQLEINFVRDIIRGRRVRNACIPYAFVGLGGFYFMSWATNPITNKPVKLKSLRTEGKSYDPYAVCIPFGLGIRFKATTNISIGAECGFRYTTTSYIDDINGINGVYGNPANMTWKGQAMYERSKLPRDPDKGYGYGVPGKQRGKSVFNDIYAMFGVTLGYRIEYVKAGVYHGKVVRKLRYR